MAIFSGVGCVDEFSLSLVGGGGDLGDVREGAKLSPSGGERHKVGAVCAHMHDPDRIDLGHGDVFAVVDGQVFGESVAACCSAMSP